MIRCRHNRIKAGYKGSRTCGDHHCGDTPVTKYRAQSCAFMKRQWYLLHCQYTHTWYPSSCSDPTRPDPASVSPRSRCRILSLFPTRSTLPRTCQPQYQNHAQIPSLFHPVFPSFPKKIHSPLLMLRILAADNIHIFPLLPSHALASITKLLNRAPHLHPACLSPSPCSLAL